MALEIERKFLLKEVPKNVEWDIIYNITQIYCEKDGERFRLRERKSLIPGAAKTQYFKTIKHEIEEGVYEEDETEISMSDYIHGFEFETKRLSKIRYVKATEDGLKWEVDDFGKLVIAEIELKEKGQHVELPEYININLILEVTHLHQFKNFNLAEKA
jgi:CYTH domain-containing protein